MWMMKKISSLIFGDENNDKNINENSQPTESNVHESPLENVNQNIKNENNSTDDKSTLTERTSERKKRSLSLRQIAEQRLKEDVAPNERRLSRTLNEHRLSFPSNTEPILYNTELQNNENSVHEHINTIDNNIHMTPNNEYKILRKESVDIQDEEMEEKNDDVLMDSDMLENEQEESNVPLQPTAFEGTSLTFLTQEQDVASQTGPTLISQAPQTDSQIQRMHTIVEQHQLHNPPQPSTTDIEIISQSQHQTQLPVSQPSLPNTLMTDQNFNAIDFLISSQISPPHPVSHTNFSFLYDSNSDGSPLEPKKLLSEEYLLPTLRTTSRKSEEFVVSESEDHSNNGTSNNQTNQQNENENNNNNNNMTELRQDQDVIDENDLLASQNMNVLASPSAFGQIKNADVMKNVVPTSLTFDQESLNSSVIEASLPTEAVIVEKNHDDAWLQEKKEACLTLAKQGIKNIKYSDLRDKCLVVGSKKQAYRKKLKTFLLQDLRFTQPKRRNLGFLQIHLEREVSNSSTDIIEIDNDDDIPAVPAKKNVKKRSRVLVMDSSSGSDEFSDAEQQRRKKQKCNSDHHPIEGLNESIHVE